jgi:hypothetical protein
MNTYLLAKAEADGRVHVVPMDGVGFVEFHTTPAIGTRDLAGCFVWLAVSKYGAILIHASPRPSKNASDSAGDENILRLMSRADDIYNQHRELFTDTNTYIFCAVHAGSLALPDQKRLIEDKTHQMGLTPTNDILYLVPRDPINAAHGTVFVDSWYRPGMAPAVFCEDREVTHPPQQQQIAPQVVYAQQIAPQDVYGSTWLWSSEHNAHYRWNTISGKQVCEYRRPVTQQAAVTPQPPLAIVGTWVWDPVQKAYYRWNTTVSGQQVHEWAPDSSSSSSTM